MTIKNAVIAGIEYAHPYYDMMMAFMAEEEVSSKAQTGGEINHNGIEVLTEMGLSIGTTTYLDVEGIKVEPFAVLLLPEKYDTKLLELAKVKEEESKEDDDQIPDFLAMMMGSRGGRNNYEPVDPAIKVELAQLDFTIVDIAPFPGQAPYMKVIRNDKPEITAWLDVQAFSKRRNCDGDCEHCSVNEE